MYISNHIGVYDHDWRFYANFLGEPYLIDDTLVYFDGMIVYICAFHLKDIWAEYQPRALEAILSSPAFSDARGVDAWGRITIEEEISVGRERPLPRIELTDYDPLKVDATIDLASFSWEREPSARKARKSASNKGLLVRVVRRHALSANHIKLMQYWHETHDVSVVHGAMAASIASIVRESEVYLVESYMKDELVGFAVLSFPSPHHAVALQSFGRNLPGGRVGDSLKSGTIQFAIEQGAQTLHLGYSASSSHLAFKRKWGARIDGPPYREAFYTDLAGLASLFRTGRYLWQLRLVKGANTAWIGGRKRGKQGTR
jgi:hypothetical protein